MRTFKAAICKKNKKVMRRVKGNRGEKTHIAENHEEQDNPWNFINKEENSQKTTGKNRKSKRQKMIKKRGQPPGSHM